MNNLRPINISIQRRRVKATVCIGECYTQNIIIINLLVVLKLA